MTIDTEEEARGAVEPTTSGTVPPRPASTNVGRPMLRSSAIEAFASFGHRELWGRIFILEFAYISQNFFSDPGFFPGSEKCLRRHPADS